MLWGPIQPAESLQTRLRLDFGLRPAILAFNEWAVPGLGGAFFVRQLTWGCVGIALAGEIGKPLMAAKVAEAIEAFASWIALKRATGYETDDRVQGKRKFSELDAISFDLVSKGGAYVTVPFRRAATSALPGLGFCEKAESRFNALRLARPGMALAEAVLADNKVRNILFGWISEPSKTYQRIVDDVKQALLPGSTSNEECNLVRDQLVTNARRARLVSLFESDDLSLSSLQTRAGQRTFLDRVQDEAHRAQLDTCFSFELVRDASLRATQALANCIKDGAHTSSELAKVDAVRREFETLERCCTDLTGKLHIVETVPMEIRAFCNEQDKKGELERRIKALATRVPQVFSMHEGKLERGIGYTEDLVAADTNEPVEGEERTDSGLIPRPLLRLKRLCKETATESSDAA